MSNSTDPGFSSHGLAGLPSNLQKCSKLPDRTTKRISTMADHVIPHFHNDPGVATIKVGVKEFMCIGATPPFDHPHIFIDMGGDTEAICSYCSTRFVYDASLGAHSIPAECELRYAA